MEIRLHRAISRGCLAALSASLLLASALPALAGGGDFFVPTGAGSWFTAGNWNPASVPGGGDTVTVDTGGTAQIDGAQATASIATLTISNASTVDVQSGSTLNATTINVGNGTSGTLLLSGGTVNYTTLNINQGTVSATATLAQLNTAVLTGANTFSAASGSSLQINGAVSGAGATVTTIAGGGTVIYTVNTSYTGTTTINSGSTLQLGTINPGGNASTGAITDNGTLLLSHGANFFVLGNSVSGTGGITIAANNSANVTLIGTNTYSGTTSILGGKMTLGNTAAVSPNTTFAVSSGATLDLQQISPTLNNLTGAGTVLIDQTDIGGQTLKLKNANFTGTITQNTPGGGIPIVGQNLVQVERGTSILAGTDSWTGTTTINATGTLQFGNGGTGGNLPSGNITDNGTLIINHSDNITYAGTLSGSGVLQQAGTGILTITGTNNLTGGTSVTSGILSFSSASNFGTGGVTLNGGTLQWAAGNTADISSILTLGSSGGTFDTNGNNVTLAGNLTGTGGITKAGLGILTLTGTNTYSGGTTIAGGTLSLGSSGAAGTGPITTTGSVIDYANGDAIANAIIINSNTTQLQVLTGSATQSGVISEAGGSRPLEKIGGGTLILTGVNTLSGTTTVTAGTLQVGTAAIPTAALPGPITVGVNGTLSGFGKVGAVTNNGTVAPGLATGSGIGTLTAASYTQASTGKLSIEVSPTSASQLKSTGAAALGGNLNLVFDPGVYTAKTYAIVTGSSVTGTFATTTGTVPTAGLAQAVTYSATEADLVLGGGSLVVAPANDTIYTALTSAGIEAAQSANMTVLGRLSDRRGSRALDGSADETTPSGLELWTKGNFNSLTANASATAPSFTAQNPGFLVGADWAWGPKAIVGLEGGYARDSVAEATLAAGGISVVRIGAYGGYADGPLTADATLGWSGDSISAKRPVAIGTATSSHSGNEFNAAFRVGYQLLTDDMIVFTPNAGLNYASMTENGITETGASGFNLSASGRNTSSARPFIGAMAGKLFQSGDGTSFTPQLHVDFSSELGDARRNMTVTTASGSNFAVIGVAPSRDMVGLGAGLIVQSRDDLAFTINYDALLFSNLTVHTATAGLQYRF